MLAMQLVQMISTLMFPQETNDDDDPFGLNNFIIPDSQFTISNIMEEADVCVDTPWSTTPSHDSTSHHHINTSHDTLAVSSLSSLNDVHIYCDNSSKDDIDRNMELYEEESLSDPSTDGTMYGSSYSEPESPTSTVSFSTDDELDFLPSNSSPHDSPLMTPISLNSANHSITNRTTSTSSSPQTTSTSSPFKLSSSPRSTNENVPISPQNITPPPPPVIKDIEMKPQTDDDNDNGGKQLNTFDESSVNHINLAPVSLNAPIVMNNPYYGSSSDSNCDSPEPRTPPSGMDEDEEFPLISRTVTRSGARKAQKFRRRYDSDESADGSPPNTPTDRKRKFNTSCNRPMKLHKRTDHESKRPSTQHGTTTNSQKQNNFVTSSPSSRRFISNGRTSSKKKRTSVRDRERTHECPICSSRFAESTTLKRHLRIHTGEKPYECGHKCGKFFAELTTARRHMLTHSKAKPYKCPCDDCKSAFSRGSSLGKHIERVHGLPRDSPLTIAATTRSKKGRGKKNGISGWDKRCEEVQALLRQNLENIANSNPPIVYHKSDNSPPLQLPIYPDDEDHHQGKNGRPRASIGIRSSPPSSYPNCMNITPRRKYQKSLSSVFPDDVPPPPAAIPRTFTTSQTHSTTPNLANSLSAMMHTGRQTIGDISQTSLSASFLPQFEPRHFKMELTN